jgi:predicted short-subunit dehydrogenase-like oxidoreductase (DUF2520 family)
MEDGLSSQLLKDPAALSDADVVFLCVPDDQIASASKSLPKSKALIVHCSGGMSMDVLEENPRYGVFYMLQTFTKPVKNSEDRLQSKLDKGKQDFGILLEANNADDLAFLKHLAEEISTNVNTADSETRVRIHCAAVFANNFTNHCLAIAKDICARNHTDGDLLNSLILETFKKAMDHQPKEIQTGPVRRNDNSTIQRHLELLTKEEASIYKAMSRSIKNMYEL